MKLFSNGQFDVKDRVYVFNPREHRFIQADTDQLMKTKENPDLFFLYYSASKTADSNIKHFDLELICNGEVLERGDGIITRTEPNKIYEGQVKYMLRKAVELSA